jgi:hypothetical protein
MKTLTWYSRLADDPRVLAVGGAARDGWSWVYVECRSVRTCESLLRYLQQHVAAWVARKSRMALWLEEGL